MLVLGKTVKNPTNDKDLAKNKQTLNQDTFEVGAQTLRRKLLLALVGLQQLLHLLKSTSTSEILPVNTGSRKMPITRRWIYL